MRKQNSFTLIELLVVIAIIGILAAIALPSLANVRAKARDARRLADLDQLAKAMELYFSDYNHYPIWESGCLTSGNPLTADTTSSPAFFTSQYMKTVPKDPLPNKYCYYYKSDSAGVNFKMAAYLEKDTARSTNDGGTATYYYEVYAGPTGSGTAIPLSDDTLNTAMAGAPPGPPVSWTVDGLIYTTRKKLTIDQTKVDDDLIDFPVLVKLTSSNFDFSKANADGYDIRFTSSDGVTL